MPTWQNIVDMTPEQFNKLSKQELRGYTQILASAGNKRIKRMQEAGQSSKSMEAVLQRGKFSTAGKSQSELRAEFMRAKRYLESKTGSLAGAKKVQRETINTLHEKGINVSSEQYGEFWRIYEELKKNDPTVANKGMMYAVLERIAEYQRDHMESHEILENMQADLQGIYENQKELQNGFEQDNPFQLG